MAGVTLNRWGFGVGVGVGEGLGGEGDFYRLLPIFTDFYRFFGLSSFFGLLSTQFVYQVYHSQQSRMRAELWRTIIIVVPQPQKPFDVSNSKAVPQSESRVAVVAHVPTAVANSISRLPLSERQA